MQIRRQTVRIVGWILLLTVQMASAIPFMRSGLVVVGTTRRHTLTSVDTASIHLLLRGGSSVETEESEDEESEQDTPEASIDADLQKWRLEQQTLMQLRSTYLSEVLQSRLDNNNIIPSLQQVATATLPPQPVDWDCCWVTPEQPKTCLYTFDAEPYTKVVAPIDKEQWIGLSALNRLRRTDPTKVEPMWHSQYAILQSWFAPESPYSLMQHVPSALLLDVFVMRHLKLWLIGLTIVVLLAIMPLLETMVNAILVSPMVWKSWPRWGRFVHAALPLKLLLGQMAWKYCGKLFGIMESSVRDKLVDLECRLLEEYVPLTVGPGSQPVEDQAIDEAKNEEEWDEEEETALEDMIVESSSDDFEILERDEEESEEEEESDEDDW